MLNVVVAPQADTGEPYVAPRTARICCPPEHTADVSVPPSETLAHPMVGTSEHVYVLGTHADDAMHFVEFVPTPHV
jgi:hypothetical protein